MLDFGASAGYDFACQEEIPGILFFGTALAPAEPIIACGRPDGSETIKFVAGRNRRWLCVAATRSTMPQGGSGKIEFLSTSAPAAPFGSIFMQDSELSNYFARDWLVCDFHGCNLALRYKKPFRGDERRGD
ncbi:MAG: hypothetical protein IJ719_08295 [Clostridia bacterium]|nr:hypothetical protein [Clostridia bacterium]